MSLLLHNLLHFVRLLRRLGSDVQAARASVAAEALTLVDIRNRDDFYHALRALLVRRIEDLPVFDAAFRAFWRYREAGRSKLDLRPIGRGGRFGEPEVELASLTGGAERAEESASPERIERIELRTYSGREALRQKDFAALSAEELEQAQRLLSELEWEPGRRRSKRWKPGEGPSIDARRMLRRELRHGDAPLEPPRRIRAERLRPLVLLCDVSGSMERYSRMLLHFAYCLAGRLDQLEAFVFATRLTRITQELRRSGVNQALARLAARTPDFSGGTRIGGALRAFHLHWRRRALRRGGVVLLISDGWDRGDPKLLHSEIARLQRSCYRLIWLNPLLGSPSYEPLTRGMQAALPFVDDFLPVHNIASLEDLARRLNDLPPRRQGTRRAAA